MFWYELIQYVQSVKYSQIIQTWIPQQSTFETTKRPSRQSFRFWLTFYVWNFWCFMCRFMSIWQICHVKRLDIMLAWMPSVPWSVHLCILLKDLAHSAPAIVFPSLASLWDKLSIQCFTSLRSQIPSWPRLFLLLFMPLLICFHLTDNPWHWTGWGKLQLPAKKKGKEEEEQQQSNSSSTTVVRWNAAKKNNALPHHIVLVTKGYKNLNKTL